MDARESFNRVVDEIGCGTHPLLGGAFLAGVRLASERPEWAAAVVAANNEDVTDDGEVAARAYMLGVVDANAITD